MGIHGAYMGVLRLNRRVKVIENIQVDGYGRLA